MFANTQWSAQSASGQGSCASRLSPSLEQIFQSYDGPAFAIRFWDDSVWQRHETEKFEIWLRTERAWRILSSHPDEVSLGQAYIDGELYVRGDLFQALRALPALQQSLEENQSTRNIKIREFATYLKDRSARLLRWGPVHSKARDSASISQHYDKPTEFYKLFLGSSMVYSCAYFDSWNTSLERAQYDKLDLICRKLDLKPGDRFLDVGCGWGSLVIHAAQQYGVCSRGITLSNEQAQHAEFEIGIRRMTLSCRVDRRDFRDLAAIHLPFDRAASVGMCEHVGLRHIGKYFQTVYDTLVPGGLLLNHSITRAANAPRKRASFIDHYVFLDGEPLTLTQLIGAAEQAGFEVRDVEDLREHYEETLHRWVEGLEANEERIISLTDKRTFRIWKLYMTGSAEAFRRADIAIHQLLLSKGDGGRSNACKHRQDWYSSISTSGE